MEEAQYSSYISDYKEIGTYEGKSVINIDLDGFLFFRKGKISLQ
jgi:hypothetical protein